MSFFNSKRKKFTLSVFVVALVSVGVLFFSLRETKMAKTSKSLNTADIAQASVGSKTDLCPDSTGPTSNCTVDNTILEGQVLGASTYGSMELVTIHYAGSLLNPTLKVNSVTYCGEAMTNITQGKILIGTPQSGTSMRTEMWYKSIPKSGVCPVIVTFSADPGQRVVSTTLLYNINSISPIAGPNYATSISSSDPVIYNNPSNFNINMSMSGPKDSLLVCGYTILPDIVNGSGNKVTIFKDYINLWKFEDMKIGTNAALVWGGLGTYKQRDIDSRFDSVIWKTLKGPKWSAICTNFNVKPLTAAIVPATTVDVKAQTSNGPVTVPYNSSVTISWSSAFATSCTASGAWTGMKTVTGSQVIAGVVANGTYTLTCDGVADSVSVVVAPKVDLKIGTSDGPVNIPYNGSFTLSWTTAGGATACTASGSWTGAQLVNGSLIVSAVTANKTYTLTCNGGTDTISVVVTPPTVNLKIGTSDGPFTVPYNGSFTLSWTAPGATACTASGSWTGAKLASGSLLVTAVTTNRTYTLTCNGGTDSISVVVTQPTVDLKVGTSDGPVNVAYNGSFTLSWTTKLATACTASGSWTGAKLVNGSLVVNNVIANKTYTLTCNGVTDTISIVSLPPVVTVDLKASYSDGPVNLLWGDSVWLTWYTANATSCTASNGWTGTKAANGTEYFYPLTTTKTYTITCGGKTDSVTINVAPLPAPTESGNITYKLITPTTLPTTFTRGQVVTLVYRITEPDGTPGTPDEGFGVQTYVDNTVQSVVGVNGEYDATTGNWTSKLTMPSIAGTYTYYSSAYCGRWKSGRYSCGYKYTTFQRQQLPNPSVSIIVK